MLRPHVKNKTTYPLLGSFIFASLMMVLMSLSVVSVTIHVALNPSDNESIEWIDWMADTDQEDEEDSEELDDEEQDLWAFTGNSWNTRSTTRSILLYSTTLALAGQCVDIPVPPPEA